MTHYSVRTVQRVSPTAGCLRRAWTRPDRAKHVNTCAALPIVRSHVCSCPLAQFVCARLKPQAAQCCLRTYGSYLLLLLGLCRPLRSVPHRCSAEWSVKGVAVNPAVFDEDGVADKASRASGVVQMVLGGEGVPMEGEELTSSLGGILSIGRRQTASRAFLDRVPCEVDVPALQEVRGRTADLIVLPDSHVMVHVGAETKVGPQPAGRCTRDSELADGSAEVRFQTIAERRILVVSTLTGCWAHSAAARVDPGLPTGRRNKDLGKLVRGA